MDNISYRQSEFYLNLNNIALSDWYFIEPVDLVIEDIVSNKKVSKYIISTNKKILKNPSYFKDLGKDF